MNVNFNSGLFSGMGSSSGSSGLYGLLGEYNNIRSGAYYKALKGYFNSQTQKTSSASGTSKTDSTKKNSSDLLKELKSSESNELYTKVKSEAADLKKKTAALTETGDKSLFVEKEKVVKDEKTGEESKVKEVDTKAIHSAVKEFVSAYNDTLKAAYNSGDKGVIRNAGYMTNQSKIFSRALEEVGITVNKDNTLSIDEEKLSSAKTDNLKTLFNGKNSYASFVSQRADMVSNAATTAATSSNSIYKSNGSYNYFDYNSMNSSLQWYL